ncbi:MAG TPA: hypothetical protein VH062_00280 [Polyangiaceae bacterium]|nr:hypothetical protein [Polyangiaceae bacterium]
MQFITEHPGSTVTRIRATKLVPSHRNLDVVLAALQDRGHVVRRGKGFFTTTARDEQQPLPAIPPPPSGAGRDETNIEDRDLGGPAQPPRPPEGGGRGGPEQPAQAGPGPAQGGGREELGGAVPFWRKP